MIIRDSHMDSRACNHVGSALVFAPSPSTACCGHCGEVVYPAAEVITDHLFACDGDVVRWWSNAMDLEVHRCGEDASMFDGIPEAEVAPIFV